MTASPVVLDTTVLSNFASSNAVEWLVSFLDEPRTVPAVEAEIHRGIDTGHAYLEAVATECDRGTIQVIEPQTANESYYETDRRRLDAGEFKALVLAGEREWTFATDDGAGRQAAVEREIPVTGSIGILARGIVDSELSVGTADEWLATWIDDRGYFAPVESVEEVLPDDTDGSSD